MQQTSRALRKRVRRLRGPRFANCLIWAVRRWSIKGGYVIARRSRQGPWPHFLWSKNLRFFWGYQPVDKTNFVPIFHGEIRSE